MSKKPRISPRIKQLITEEALKNRSRPRMVLAAELKDLISRSGVCVLPEEETIAKLISHARMHSPEPEDEPWSMAASVKYTIPSEVRDDLLKIWQWCVVLGRGFTIREALWVVRLRGFVPFKRLLQEAAMYALSERACMALGKPFNTIDLDSRLLFPQETPTDIKVHLLARTMKIIPTDMPLEFLGKYRREISNLSADELFYLDRPLSEVLERDLGLPFSRHEQTLSPNADILYALWLKKLTTDRNWLKLTGETKDRIAIRLREEIVEICEFDERKDSPWFNRIGPVLAWDPSEELLKEAGIDQQDKRRETK